MVTESARLSQVSAMCRLTSSSLQQGSSLQIVLHDPARAGVLVEAAPVSYYVDRIDSEYTEFALSAGGALRAESDDLVLDCPSIGDLPTGLYQVSWMHLQDGAATPTVIVCREPVPLLFEIRTAGEPPRTPEQLLELYTSIHAQREASFRSGIGIGQRRYRGLAFIKNCLVTARMRLGKYEVIPFEGLSVQDELSLMERFLATAGLPLLGDTRPVREQATGSQPTTVVHFPLLLADDVNSAAALMSREASTLATLLSLQRGAAGVLFGSVLIDAATNELHYGVEMPHYSGNLLGGALAGEDPRFIEGRMQRLHQSDLARLLLGLFSEALREPRHELKYFRFWSILETMARSKNFIGQPLRDWDGRVITNERGRARTIRQAEEIVFELLRVMLASRGIGRQTYAHQLELGSLEQQIPIWYQRRNCVVHGGHCICRGSRTSEGAPTKQVNCKRARDDPAARIVDGYLSGLRSVTEDVFFAELRPYLPS